MRSTTPVVPHLRLSASRQGDRIGRLNSHPVSDDGRIDRGSPVGPQPVDPGLRADVPLANGFAMNASWSDLQTAIHDSLGDAPRGTHSKSVPRGNGRAGRASAPGGNGRAFVPAGRPAPVTAPRPVGASAPATEEPAAFLLGCLDRDCMAVLTEGAGAQPHQALGRRRPGCPHDDRDPLVHGL